MMALVALAVLAAGAARAQLPPDNTTAAQCGEDCMVCSAEGCVKRRCPAGSAEPRPEDHRLMGRVCLPARSYSELLVGGACGVAACAALACAACAYARSRRTRGHVLPPSAHDDDTKLRTFHKQLDCLRPHAYTLLAILNHTRRQVRELYLLGNNHAAMAYSCVLSDLCKLLILLNRREVPVVPPDWPRLAAWADRILKRYSRLGVAQGPVPSPSSDVQLGSFQPPSYRSEGAWSPRPPSYSQLEALDLKELERQEGLALQELWRPERRDSVWLEDELFQRTRRPQDELTTEL